MLSELVHTKKIERNVFKPFPVEVFFYFPVREIPFEVFEMSHSERPLLSQYIV